MLTVCVWGADSHARFACQAALATALKTALLNVQLISGSHADLHFLLGIDASNHADAQVADALLRQELGAAGTPYSVLYGTSASQVKKALTTIERRFLSDPFTTCTVPSTVSTWVWPCDKCGDASCEYKLLSGLLSRRAQTP